MAPKDSPVDVTDVTQPKAQVAVLLVTRVTHHFWFLGWLGPVTRITPIGVAQVCFALLMVRLENAEAYGHGWAGLERAKQVG
jgi:hypothetical protein